MGAWAQAYFFLYASTGPYSQKVASDGERNLAMGPGIKNVTYDYSLWQN